MPSWNIHIAQTEALFEEPAAVAHIVRDRNAFLFGSLVPDIYVGYMVPAVTHPIAYRITHFATPAHIPKPREHEFWDTYVASHATRLGIGAQATTAGGDEQTICASSLKLEQDFVSRTHYPARYVDAAPPVVQSCVQDDELSEEGLDRSLFDFVLGVWSHLVADNLWNTRVNEFLDAHGGKPSEQFRIKKQGDFDAFGKTLRIDWVPRPTPRLLATAARFPQYAIDEQTTLLAIGVAHETVRTNHAPAEPYQYRLLTSGFFSQTFTESVELTNRLLKERLSATHVDAPAGA